MDQIESRLAKLAQNGDRRAFAELVNLYKVKIYHLAYRMLNNRQEAEDVVQETFLRVFENLGKYDREQKFSSWIYRIGTNLCIDRLRKRKANFSLDAELSDGEGGDWHDLFAAQDASPEEQLLLSETQTQIRSAMERLPEKYKSIMVLRYLHDLSLHEISEILRLPITTIKTRIHRGREFMRKALAAENLV